MTRCSVGRATQKYRGNGTDLSDILETPGDIIYADAAVSAENLVISGTTGDVLKVSASGIPEWGASTSQWITTGDDLSYTTGKVGVGTLSPNANLHVEGNVYVSSNLEVGRTTISTTVSDGVPTVSWAKSIGGTGSDYGRGIATDSSGNVYVIGKYSGSFTIGSTTLTSAGSNDVFVAKYDTSGTAQWARSIGGTSSDTGRSIATDSAGNVYVTGIYYGSVTIGSTTLNSLYSYDTFVVKYDTSGTVQWAKSIGGTNSDYGYGIAADSAGNVYVTGIYSGTATFAPGTTLTSAGYNDAFVTKYDTSGTVQWAESIGGTNTDSGYGIATDSGGNVYVIGTYRDSVTIGSTTLPNAGFYNNAFVAKYDTSGTAQWARSIGGTGSDTGYGIATDSAGNVYVTGKYAGSVTIESITLNSAGYSDAFVAKYDTDGTFQWAESIGGTNTETTGQAIATDSDGNVYVTGIYAGSVTIGSTTFNSITGFRNDVFVAKYDTSGTVQWARSIGGADHDYGYGIATDINGNVYVVGEYSGTTTFAPGTTLTSAGSNDAFVVKYSPPSILHINKNVDVTGDINFTGSLYQNGVLFGGGGSSPWVTSGSNISYTTGNVGIGTSIPATALDVSGDVTIAGNIDFQTITQNGAPYSGTSPWVTSGNDISYSSGNVAVDTNTLFVDSVNNRVGIGTLTPTTALDVSGDVTATTFIGSLQGNAQSSDRWNTGRTLTVSGAVTGTSSLINGNQNSTLVTTLANLDTSKITTGILPVARGGTGVATSTGTGSVVLSNAPAFTGDATFDTNTLKIDSVNNWVGIATATPGYTLDVTGDVNFTGNLTQGGNPFVGGAFLTDGTKAYYTDGPVGISNVEALTTQTLQVGANVAVNDTASDKLTVTGDVYVTRTLRAVDLLETYQVNCNALFIKDVRVTNQVPHDGNDAGYTQNVL